MLEEWNDFLPVAILIPNDVPYNLSSGVTVGPMVYIGFLVPCLRDARWEPWSVPFFGFVGFMPET
jgi:hypothetical protein